MLATLREKCCQQLKISIAAYFEAIFRQQTETLRSTLVQTGSHFTLFCRPHVLLDCASDVLRNKETFPSNNQSITLLLSPTMETFFCCPKNTFILCSF